MLNLINHNEFDSTLLQVQGELHEQDFLIVTPQIGVATFQEHAPQERPGGLIAHRCLDSNDGDTIPLLFNDWADG